MGVGSSYFREISFVIAVAVVVLLVPLRCGYALDSWRPFGDDLELLELAPSSQTLFPHRLLLIRTTLNRFRVGVIRAKEFGSVANTAHILAERSHAAVTVNANFFDANGEALGLIVSRGTLFQKVHRGGGTLTGLFLLTGKGPTIMHRNDFRETVVQEGVQAGPRLIVNGAPLTAVRASDDSSRRAGVCLDYKGRLILFCSSSTFGGLTMQELQEMLLAVPVGCREALNFDGGGSAQLYVSADVPGAVKDATPLSLPGRDKVPIVLGLFATEQS
jgi:hypothetical protein